MRAIASAVVLGEEHGVPVKIVWPRNKALNCRFETLFEDIPGVSAVVGTAPLLWRFSEKAAKYRYRNAFLGTKRSNNAALLDCIRTVGGTQDIYVYSNSMFYDVDAFRMFVPRPQHLQAVEALVGAGQDMVGIHLRRGDNQRSISRSFPLRRISGTARPSQHSGRVYCGYSSSPSQWLSPV